MNELMLDAQKAAVCSNQASHIFWPLFSNANYVKHFFNPIQFGIKHLDF